MGDGTEPDDWEPVRGGSLQELRLRQLFDCPGDERPLTNKTDRLVVTGVEMNQCGDCRIVFDGALRLVIFPASSAGEYWRLFKRDDESPHFVVEGAPHGSAEL